MNQQTVNTAKKVVWAVVILAAVLELLLLWRSHSYKNPTPNDIKQQLTFTEVYPTKAKVDRSSFSYQSGSGILSYSLDYKNINLNITEQSAPPIITSGQQDFIAALGIKPVSQFNSKLGPVAIANVYTEERGQPIGPVAPIKANLIGQAGILIADKTMFIAKTDNGHTLPTDQWKDFFGRLRLSK